MQPIDTNSHPNIDMEDYLKNYRSLSYQKADGIGVILFILFIVVILFALGLGRATEKALKKAICQDDEYLGPRSVFFDWYYNYISKIQTAIKQFRMLFEQGLIHRVNQREVVYHSITIPSYIISE